MNNRLTLGLAWAAGWLVLYFVTNNLSARRKSREMKIKWDDKIPFIAGTGLLYLSTYILAVAPYLFVPEDQDFVRVLVAYSIIAGISTTIYLAFPSKVVRHEQMALNSASELSLTLFQRICKPYNSFPSMHSAYAMSAALAAGRFHSPLLGSILSIWGFAILISTLTAKQHVLLDVISGVAIGVTISFLVYW